MKLLKDFNYQCAIGLHPWGKWETLPQPATTDKHTVTQKRVCPTCGQEQLRKQTV